jgi:hypothetical protein
MKKKTTSYFVFVLILAVGLVTSCTKVGPTGPAGKDGTNGTDGTDGTAGCVQCHDNSQIILTKSLQWEASVHATGGNFERNTKDCAPCHTSQGFLERIQTGDDTTTATIQNPAPQNCYTCHEIHQTYTPDDWAITTTSPVKLWINGKTVDFGKGNLCANCHQPRIPAPLPVVGGDSVTVTSPYWGAHHGPQASILGGSGGYEVGSGYSNSSHTTVVTNGCVTCHMAEAYGVQAGGHQMGMTYLFHGHDKINTAGCIACHPSGLDAEIAATQTLVLDLLAQLKTLLVNHGAMTASGGIIPGKMSADVAGALLNYNMVKDDGSEGIHNENYVKALLNNSIQALSSK